VAQVQVQSNLLGICGEHSGSEAKFSPSTRVFSVRPQSV
jgi:hypothetical protein